MGAWTVSETGLIYEMEYTNGFKRAIRKSQIAKSNTYQGIDYSSSQNPNLVLAKILASIQSYTAGTSTIDFINNGGDDWDISFLATPTTLQSSANIVQYIYNVEYWVGGVQTNIESGSKTTDYTLNTSSNGACVYKVDQTYILDNGTFFRIDMLIKVDAVGNVIAYIKNFGSTVNSVNGLYINITANNYQFGVSYPIYWYAFDNFPPSTLTPIGIGDTINGSLPLTTVGVGYTFVLGSIFTDDFTMGIGSTISTNIS